MRRVVEDESVPHKACVRLHPVPPQNGAQARKQDLLRERFGDVVVRPGIKSVDDIALLAFRRQHDDGDGRRVGIRPQGAADGERVLAWPNSRAIMHPSI